MDVCNGAMDTIVGNPRNPNFNVYDIREKCNTPPLCYDFSMIDNMMMNATIQQVLGVTGRKWEECANDVHLAMLGDWMTNLGPKVSDIANKGDVDILVYSGDKDFICNWRGGEAWTLNMDW